MQKFLKFILLAIQNYTEGIVDIWHSLDIEWKVFLLSRLFGNELISIFVYSLTAIMLILMWTQEWNFGWRNYHVIHTPPPHHKTAPELCDLPRQETAVVWHSPQKLKLYAKETCRIDVPFAPWDRTELIVLWVSCGHLCTTYSFINCHRSFWCVCFQDL
jgi:hypothetical protein